MAYCTTNPLPSDTATRVYISSFWQHMHINPYTFNGRLITNKSVVQHSRKICSLSTQICKSACLTQASSIPLTNKNVYASVYQRGLLSLYLIQSHIRCDHTYTIVTVRHLVLPLTSLLTILFLSSCLTSQFPFLYFPAPNPFSLELISSPIVNLFR